MLNWVKSTKVFTGACAVLLALFLCVAAPVGQAHAAEVSRSIDSTLTVTMQQSSSGDESSETTNDGKGSTDKAKKPVAANEKGGGLALTGDALLLAMLGIVALGGAAAYCLLQSKNLSVVEGAHMRGAHTRSSQRAGHARGRKSLAAQNRDEAQKKMIAATIAAALVAATCFGGFASKTNALAEAIGELVSCNSSVVVDESGNVVSSNITVVNNTSKKISVEEAVAPSKLSNWEASFAESDVASKSSATGTWDGKTVPEDVLAQVKSNGSATLKFQQTFKYDNTETTGESGSVTVFDPKAGKDQIITVTDADGNHIKDAVVDTDVNGKTNVAIPDEAIEKNVVVTITDEEINPEVGKEVEFKNENGASIAHGKTNNDGQTEYIANGGKTDDNGEVNVTKPENLTIKVTDDQNNPIERATVVVDKTSGQTTVILPEEEKGKNVVVIITDENGDGKNDVSVTLDENDGEDRGTKTTNNDGKVEFKVLDFSLFSLEVGTWTYDSTQQKPEVICTGTLVKDTDYVVSYGENINAGEGTVTVTGIEPYSGSKEFKFTINKASLTFTWTYADAAPEYDAQTHTPTLTVTGASASETVTPTVTYTKKGDESATSVTPKDAATYFATASITTAEAANYSLPTNTTKEFEIAQRTVVVTWTEFNGGAAVTYDGADHATVAPTATIQTNVAGESLTATVQLKLGDNTTTEVKKAGSYTASVASLTPATTTPSVNVANYKIASTNVKTFSIAQKEVEIAWTNTTIKWDGTAKKPTATVTNKIGEDVVNVTVTGEQSAEGTYTATADAITGAAAENYKLPATKPTTQFTIKKIYTVSFKELADDGSTVAVEGVGSIDVDSGQKCNKPTPNPEKTGYIFKGWFTDSACTTGKEAFDDDGISKEAITADVTYYAKWVEGYNVKFLDSTDGTTEVCKTIEVAKGATFTKPADPEKAGRYFAGWYTNQGCTEANVYTFANGVSPAVTGPLTLYAKWSDALVVFDASAPSGTTATVDGSSAKVSKGLATGATLTSDLIPADTAPTCSNSSYTFMGWSESKDAIVTSGKKKADLAGDGVTITGTKTYYALWFKDDGTFWMSNTNTSGTQQSDFTGLTNYRTAKQIVEDMRVMHVGNTTANATAYSEVTTRWGTYYDNDVKLYATYSGGASEKMYDGTTTSALNGLVEFRILEVSGEAGHLNTNGVANSSDGSVVTFMATHVLPTAEDMNATGTSNGGWNAMPLRAKLQSGGAIYNKFPTALTSAIKKVDKLNHVGGNSSDQSASGTTTNDLFWLISYSEIYYTGTYFATAPMNEGTAYKWCIDKNIDGSNANGVLAYTTRSGATPGSCDFNYCCWWQRSPRVGNNGSYFDVSKDGKTASATYPYRKLGVAPAFCF